MDALFRRESGRLVSALVRAFGVHNLAFAEDVAQDALCRALEIWKLSGVPDNPSGWLMATARNRAIDLLRRDRTGAASAARIGYAIDVERVTPVAMEDLFRPAAIKDDLLRMMFSCCDPRLPEEAQVALVLNILCGFSVAEIASAFLTSREAIKKRITRAKEMLAKSRHLFDLTGSTAFDERVPVVQRTLYLLFNEGYHGACPTAAVRVELCHEAMRLASMLLAHEPSATPESHALLALMCLHAARLPGRLDEAGDLTLLADQDRSVWDKRLIEEGTRLLNLSATGTNLSRFHVEAGIAALHASADRPDDIPWADIASLYDTLMDIRPTPVAALSRALVLSQLHGPERGLAEIAEIADVERLEGLPMYPAAVGELELRAGRVDSARDRFREALNLSRNDAERRFFARRIQECGACRRRPRATRPPR
jgi:RNA polymerase sigma-70 factor (ECF subfamily)